MSKQRIAGRLTFIPQHPGEGDTLHVAVSRGDIGKLSHLQQGALVVIECDEADLPEPACLYCGRDMRTEPLVHQGSWNAPMFVCRCVNKQCAAKVESTPAHTRNAAIKMMTPQGKAVAP